MSTKEARDRMKDKIVRLQRYKLELLRQSDGHWIVRAYWEVNDSGHPYGHKAWDLDGAPRYFATRKEALEFCMTQSGIPE
jgi:hypothetical protein